VSDLPPFSYPQWRWEPWANVSIQKGGGPERVVTDDPDPDFKPRRVGFTADLLPPEVDPQTWEGDDS
jgi:hypothetical protein